MKNLIVMFIFLFSSNLYCQSLSVFDMDISNLPTIKAKFFAFDKDGNQIRNLQPSDFEVLENGQGRTVTSVSCPQLKPLQKVSVAMSIDVSGSMSFSRFGEIPIELGKTTARELCNQVAMPPSEFALQTCHHQALIIYDFTTNKSKALSAIEPIKASGDNDFVEHLLNSLTGLLNIAKTGKHKRVAVLYTDAWWYALTSEELQLCKDTCSKYDIQFYAVIYSRPESEPNGIKKSLQELADFTGGLLYDGITTSAAAFDIGKKIQQVAQGGEPCEIEWQSGVNCVAGITNYELKITNLGLVAKGSYQSPNTSIAKLEFNPTFISFKNPPIGTKVEQKITVTARNADFTVTNITGNNAGFSITPSSFVLAAGQSIELTVNYFPVDSGYNICKFEIENDVCPAKYYASGGWRGKKPSIRTLKLIHPNGGEVFVAGSDTVITWEGVAPDEPVIIDYSIDNGVNWVTISDSATGLSYNWRVPKTPSNLCLARVTAAAQSVPATDIEMVPIPAGTFLMGNTGAYSGNSNEKPVHTVTISRDFLMSKYEVTQKQYEEVMGTNPSDFKTVNHPVEKVTWFEAIEFCNKLSEMEGLDKCYIDKGTIILCDWDANGYRLPTEAEWEYACKAGTTTDFYSGSLTNSGCSSLDNNLDRIGWYCGNAATRTHEVGQKEPNAFGLYDMSGNVSEWCWDSYGDYTGDTVTDPISPLGSPNRIIRGGGISNYPAGCRSASRYQIYPHNRYNTVGFRVVRIF